jgi:organic radical activating enzyme
MKIKLKCPKCGEDLELTTDDDQLRKVLNSALKPINNIIVIPTWKCGLNCPYCQYHQQKDNKSIIYTDKLYHVEKELDVEDWIKLLDGFSPAFYNFSGGEPLRYKGIIELLNHLQHWAITSNTLHFTKDINVRGCESWTASFHPHIPEDSKKLFFDNIAYIKRLGVPVGVTLVAKPETIENVLEWSEKIAAMGYAVHIHPYYDDKEFSWYDYPSAIELLKASPYLMYGEKLFEYKGIQSNGECHGGIDYFAIGPDGRIFRCLTDLLLGRQTVNYHTDKCNDLCLFPCDWQNMIEEKR